MKSVRRIGCWTVLVLFVTLGTLVFLFTTFRQERSDFSGRTVRGNIAILGGDVRIKQDEHVPGNLLIIGDDLALEGQIGGNLVVVGGDVDLIGTSRVGGNISVLGGDAEVGGASSIGGNVAVVGGDVDLTGTSRVGGNVSVLGGQIAQDPAAQVGGGTSWKIYTNSVAHPNLYAAAPALAVLPDPPLAPQPLPAQERVAGTLENEVQAQIALHRQAALQPAAEAQAQAALHREAALKAAAEARSQATSNRTPWFLVFLGKIVQAFLWTLLITGLVLLVDWLLPKQVEAITQTAERETALSFATGAIAVMGSAILVAILTITICFALLALPLLALLALVMLCGWTVTCYWLGRRLDEILAGQGSLSLNPLISVGLCSLVITGVTTFSWAIFPCLGFIMALLIGSIGTGAVIVHVARGSGRRSSGVSAGGSDAPGPAAVATAPNSAEASPSDTSADTSQAHSPDLYDMQAEANESLVEEPVGSEEEPSSPASVVPSYTEIPPADSDAPAEPDDLTRLAGIGPVFSERLRDAGITTFSQLAALDEEQIAEALDWSASRVARERLRERAEELADEQ
jgi:predicted flap endonuclease-1-like 5' DNA nuclease